MKQAAESGALDSFFTSNGTQQTVGFANRLSRIADDVAAAHENFTRGVRPTYSDEMLQRSQLNNFQLNRMDRFLGMGLLMNMMF
jgi:hypothetical protein